MSDTTKEQSPRDKRRGTRSFSWLLLVSCAVVTGSLLFWTEDGSGLGVHDDADAQLELERVAGELLRVQNVERLDDVPEGARALVPISPDVTLDVRKKDGEFKLNRTTLTTRVELQAGVQSHTQRQEMADGMFIVLTIERHAATCVGCQAWKAAQQ